MIFFDTLGISLSQLVLASPVQNTISVESNPRSPPPVKCMYEDDKIQSLIPSNLSWGKVKTSFSLWFSKEEITPLQKNQEELRHHLSIQIQQLKKSNQEYANAFNEMRQFLENDEELFLTFLESKELTRDILLPPPIVDDSLLVNDPLVEEWRREAQKESYFENVNTRLKEFSFHNPEFYRLFIQKYSAKSGQRQSKPHEKRQLLLEDFSNHADIILSTKLTRNYKEIESDILSRINQGPFQKTEELKLLSSLRRINLDTGLLFAKVKFFLSSDLESASLFHRWVEPKIISFTSQDNKNISSDSSDIICYRKGSTKTAQFAIMKSSFLDFFEVHPDIKKKFLSIS